MTAKKKKIPKTKTIPKTEFRGRKEKLTEELMERIIKKLKIGAYVKMAIASENISERTYYRWLERGQRAEKLLELGQKIPVIEVLFCQFCQSVRQAEAEANIVLTTMVFSKGQEDWKAALEMLARKWPEQWARKDFLDFKGTIDQRPDAREEALNEFEEMYAGIPKGQLSQILSETTRKLREAKNGNSKAGRKTETSKKGINS